MRLLFFVLALSLSSPVKAASRLNIYFEHGSVYDAVCGGMTKSKNQSLGEKSKALKVTPKVLLEAEALTERLQKIWNQEGPALLGGLTDLVGRDFKRAELTAYTIACDFGSMSTPFLISIRRYLKTLSVEPAPAGFLVQTVFHELIHKYLVQTFDYSRSTFLKKHKNSKPRFRNHLHLMALEKAVYERTGRLDLLERAKALYTVYGKDGPYDRAWKLATKKDVQETLVREVKENALTQKSTYQFF